MSEPRARVEIADDLEEQLARAVTPIVSGVTDRVQRRARELAPGTKTWETKADPSVCESCRKAHGQTVPDNLRFELDSFEWDREHQGSGPVDYLLEPRNPAGTGTDYLVLTHHSPQKNLKRCRCRKVSDPEGIARHVGRTAVKPEPTRVVGTVFVKAPDVVGAELGQVYQTPRRAIVELGTRFMEKAAAEVAAETRAGH